MNTTSPFLKTIVILLAIVGALAVIGVLGMWLMHSTMMGGSGMGGMCDTTRTSMLMHR